MAPLKSFPKSTLLLAFLRVLSAVAAWSSSPAKVSYYEHCGSIVPQPSHSDEEIEHLDFLQLHHGYFHGGGRFLGVSKPPLIGHYDSFFDFQTTSLTKTDAEGVLRMQVTLTFYDGFRNYSSSRRSHWSYSYDLGWKIRLQLQGFWSASTGKLCLVGDGYGWTEDVGNVKLLAVAKLNYPKSADISSSIVTGTVESVDSSVSSGYFSTISVLGFSQKKYEYKMAPEMEGACSGDDPNGKKYLSLEEGTTVCSMLRPLARSGFELKYGSGCATGKCENSLQGDFLKIDGLQCSEDGKLRFFLQFVNSSSSWYRASLTPATGMVAEGVWDEDKNLLCAKACRLKGFERSIAETRVGECSVGLNLSFPGVWSIKERSAAVGGIWSLRKKDEPEHFDRIEFRSSSGRSVVSRMKYQYTQLHRARQSPCATKKDAGAIKKGKGKEKGKPEGRFPDVESFRDMNLDSSSIKGGPTGGSYLSATLLSMGDVVIDDGRSSGYREELKIDSSSNRSIRNVSYSIFIDSYSGNRSERMEISAEGVYDTQTGALCMVGCRSVSAISDCDIVVSFSFAPYHSRSNNRLLGTIHSSREKTDPLYFKKMEFSSSYMYAVEARETIWRVDMEMAMVLLSLTLACIFIALQIRHARRNPDTVPSMSIFMLLVLTLGHMVPLILNFEAMFFGDGHRRSAEMWAERWIEAKEVIVRLITMAAFLLQFRLLQLAISARWNGGKGGVWNFAEKLAFWMCLGLYLGGGLIAWSVHGREVASDMGFMDITDGGSSQSSLRGLGWEDVRSFAGLAEDGFLLPQILLNLFSNSNEKALTPSFYVGTTLVRLLPHAYDAYRAHKSLPYLNHTYIYADPKWDLYSATWDAVIPCGGLLLAFIIFCQQRFGGSAILPAKMSRYLDYEKVPVSV